MLICVLSVYTELARLMQYTTVPSCRYILVKMTENKTLSNTSRYKHARVLYFTVLERRLFSV